MTITIPKQLEIAVGEQAKRRGVAPEALALEAIRERFMPSAPSEDEHEAWMKKLRGAASECGVSLSNEAISSEGLYD